MSLDTAENPLVTPGPVCRMKVFTRSVYTGWTQLIQGFLSIPWAHSCQFTARPPMLIRCDTLPPISNLWTECCPKLCSPPESSGVGIISWIYYLYPPRNVSEDSRHLKSNSFWRVSRLLLRALGLNQYTEKARYPKVVGRFMEISALSLVCRIRVNLGQHLASYSVMERIQEIAH